MSELKALELKIDNLHDRHDESTVRMERSIGKMSESIETFVAFSARAEERHSTSSARLDKFETKLEKLWDMVHKNSLVVNGVIGLLCLVVGSYVSWLLRS